MKFSVRLQGACHERRAGQHIAQDVAIRTIRSPSNIRWVAIGGSFLTLLGTRLLMRPSSVMVVFSSLSFSVSDPLYLLYCSVCLLVSRLPVAEIKL